VAVLDPDVIQPGDKGVLETDCVSNKPSSRDSYFKIQVLQIIEIDFVHTLSKNGRIKVILRGKT
jgi:hypothetical protein